MYPNYSRSDLGIKIISCTRLECNLGTVLVLELLYVEADSHKSVNSINFVSTVESVTNDHPAITAAFFPYGFFFTFK